MTTELSHVNNTTPIPPTVIGIVVVYCLYWFFYLVKLCFNKENTENFKNDKNEKKEKNEKKNKNTTEQKVEKVNINIVDVIDAVDKMSDDNIHDLIAHLAKRCIILNWYDREHLSMVLGESVDRKDWNVILRRQGDMAEATNDLVREWASCIMEDISNASEEDEQDTQKTLEDVLYTLSNNQLRMYAGVTSTNKTKVELVDMILQQLQNNMKKVIDRKLERMASLLS